MKKGTAGDRIFAVGLLAGLVILYVLLRLYGLFFLPSEPSGVPTYIHVPRGASAEDIANKLVAHGVLHNRLHFLIAARMMRAEKDLKFGEYELNAGMAPVAAVRRLTAGRALTRRLTIPEGLTIEQIGKRLESSGLTSKDDFLERARSQEMREMLAVRNDTLEGFLFPDTYYIITGEETPDSLVRMMVNRFEEVYRNESAESDLGGEYDGFDVVTIASMVEKEAFLDSEKPVIAGVIYNRLRKEMRLDCDVTIQYALNKYGHRLTYADLAVDSPYNTYVNQGLPPGPICNPGRASLRAALRPAQTEYLYFVSKNNGTHHFSETLAEHNSAVRKYQLGL
jgi:UPF0755 protein